MTDVQHVRVQELGTSVIEIPRALAVELRAREICAVQPTRSPDRWALSAFRRVGVLTVEGTTLEIEPKASLDALVHMVSRGGRQATLEHQVVERESARSMPTALAHALAHETSALAAGGLLRGYRTVEETGMVVRGRWDVPRQIGRRPGMPLPVELTIDDFTVDIDENRMLAGALAIAKRFDGLPPAVRAALEASSIDLAGVQPIRLGSRLPRISLDRRSERYAPALRVARWILEQAAWTQRSGVQQGRGFLVDMAAVFESFVAAELMAALRTRNLTLGSQETDWRLDMDGALTFRPDLVVRDDSRIVTVADTKYKVLAGGLRSVRNTDAYQILAYATAMGAKNAELIYTGEWASYERMAIRGSGITVGIHVLPLSGGGEALRDRIAAIAERISVDATARAPVESRRFRKSPLVED